MAIGNFLGGGIVGGLIGGVAGAIEGIFGNHQHRCHQQFGQHGNSPCEGRAGGPGNAYQHGFMQGERAEDMQHLQRHMHAMGGSSPHGDMGGALASGAQLNMFMNFNI